MRKFRATITHQITFTEVSRDLASKEIIKLNDKIKTMLDATNAHIELASNNLIDVGPDKTLGMSNNSTQFENVDRNVNATGK